MVPRGLAARAGLRSKEIPLTLPEEARTNNDGETKPLIPDFLRVSGASLGGSKSLVDQSGEDQAVLGFMTHLNQVGQTGSTPRHSKWFVHLLPWARSPMS